MKITPEQIEQLYAFTRKHYVEYYDLQTELVDHLANAIEQQWQENPNVSFEDALQTEFKKFGIFGFTDLVERRKEALRGRYSKIVNKHLKEFFKIPKILLTLMLIWVIHFLFLKFKFIDDLGQYILHGLLILYFVGRFYFIVKYKLHAKQTSKKWLFKKILFGNYINVFGWYWVYKLVTNFIYGYHPWDYWFLSTVWVFVMLYLYIIFILIPSKAGQYLKETYPEYELSN